VSLALDWVSSRGAVRFTLTNPAAGETVKRVRPGGSLASIRGYSSAAWWAGTTEAIGYDYEMPLGVVVTYAVVAASVSQLPATAVTDTIFTMTPGATNGEAWLRDVLQPNLSIPVGFVSSGDELRPARQTVLEIAGRRNPYVVWDVRLSRTGTVTLAVANNPIPGVWTSPTNRQKLEVLFDSGRPLLLSVCHRLGFLSCYMAVADVRFPRVGSGPLWAVEVDYTEIDVPLSEDIKIAPEVDYTLAQSIPAGALYSDWATVTYYEIATRRSV
jgi:hypothetical protein